MSTPARALPFAGLLVLTLGFGALATTATPPGAHAIGVWPIAVATACFMLSFRPPTWALVPTIAATAALTIWIGDRPVSVAVGLGIGLGLQAWLTWRTLMDGRRGRPDLLTGVDLARFLVAVTAGAAVMAAAGSITSEVTGWGDPSFLALSVGSAGFASQLPLLPFVCRLRHHPATAGRTERLAQWILLAATTAAVFVPTDFPSLLSLVIPVLVWGALRGGSYHSLAQLVVVLAVAFPMTTYGYGPLARPDLHYDVPVDMQGVLLAVFVSVCALVVVSLTLAVGERDEVAREVAAERDRMRNIVDGVTNVAIIGADPTGRVTLFNPGAERLLGYDADEVIGRSTRMLHSSQAVTEKAAELGVEDDFSLVAQTLMTRRGDTVMKFVRKDGQERSHAMSLNRVTDQHGQVLGFVSTSEDITERLRAEARLVDALAAEREAVERLREVDRVKDAFVSSVSHELRTPITSILGYTELLESGDLGELDDRQRDAVDRVSSNSARLLGLISELLTLSKIQADDVVPADGAVDLGVVMSAGLSVLSPTLARRDVRLSVHLPDHPVRVTGDQDMLERVVINLTDNAVKFTPDGGSVDVALLEEPGRVVIQVSDTGIGVPRNEQQRLFDSFFRSSLAQQRAIPGSGLGLSISRTIVEKHGGHLRVTSEPDVGSTFRVELPAAT